ncbi:ABC transporter permease subunit [Kineosporia succinea]|uniref:ABC-type transport system involved in multi-copper enzyme maturation permease subunit n=1 Tax=Kineosporia succinea TaxID=84632 RepID=A0ABT9NZL7_9ACTN|nr:ABC transporter permease subunit [Kineosporia succinea]MDP9825881.1 ABC-type transport system involved in multi-copper enzyme maturation permease subunit [Kineosporia succinea]
MSAQTALPAWAAPGATQDLKVNRPSMLTLTRIELRKMADTRAGRWLLIITAGLVALVIGAMAIWGDDDSTLLTYVQLAAFPITVFGPVLGIMTVTSEWSQRTALTTFTLVPQRGKVIAAKLLAALVLSVITMAVTLAVAAVATLFSGARDPWDVTAVVVAELVLFVAINFAIGVGFGLLFGNTPVAIVCFFALPIVFSLASMFSALQTPSEWLNPNATLEVLINAEGISGQEWAKVLATVALWMVAPLVIGAVRTVRREVK